MKKVFILILISIFLCGCSIGSSEEPAEAMETLPAGAKEIGVSSYSCITGSSEETEQVSENETAKVVAFAHRIYDPNNKYITTLTNTIVGTYSPKENTTQITKVSGTLSDTQMEGLAVSEHLSGDTATVILYLNQMSICYFQYRLSADGTLEFLS